MTEYNSICVFGSVKFALSNVNLSRQPGTLKTNMGKTFIEKLIPGRNNVNIILKINGVINGLSKTAGETLSDAIERDRTALIALEDGFKHSYDDGKHNGDFVMVSESLKFSDEANRATGQPYKFSIIFKEW